MSAAPARPYRHIEVQPVAGALGAEIRGVNLSASLPGEVIAEIRRAFLDHLAIFFRDQKLRPQEQLAFASRFGEPMEYPQLKGLPEAPMITPVVKLEHEHVNFGGVWHSDTTYLAYETLSDGLRRTLDGLVGVNTSAKADASKTREERLRSAGVEMKVLVGEHPVVRTHPETARRALYVNVGHTAHFKGWTEEESRALLEHLFHHQVRIEFTCRFQWQPGSLAFWDNRCTQHNAVNDYAGFRRIMHRVTLAGDVPR